MKAKIRELKGKERRELKWRITNRFPSLNKFPELVAETKINSFQCFLDNSNKIQLIQNEAFLFPSLMFLRTLSPDILSELEISKVVVDSGAVKPVLSGANVFRPGIISYDELSPGSIVLVQNQQGSPLAVGKTMVDSDKMDSTDQGLVVQTLHHLGDLIWSFEK